MASDFISDLLLVSLPIKGFAILTLLSMTKTNWAPLPTWVIEEELAHGLASIKMELTIITDIIILVSILIFLEKLSWWNILILLIINLSDTEINKGKAASGIKRSQYGAMKVI